MGAITVSLSLPRRVAEIASGPELLHLSCCVNFPIRSNHAQFFSRALLLPFFCPSFAHVCLSFACLLLFQCFRPTMCLDPVGVLVRLHGRHWRRTRYFFCIQQCRPTWLTS